jgi:hypothetical protein
LPSYIELGEAKYPRELTDQEAEEIKAFGHAE